MNSLRWFLTAAIAAYACVLAVHHATPTDRALPLLAVAVTLCAAVSYSPVMRGVLLLIGAEIAIAEETMRLLAFGAVVAGAVGVAMVGRSNRGPSSGLRPPFDSLRAGSSPRMRGEGQQSLPVIEVFSRGERLVAPRPAEGGEGGRRPDERTAAVTITILTTVLLRWIPFENVQLGRELLLLGLCAAIVLVLGRTPFAMMIAVVTALATPAIPLRTLALPLIVLVMAVPARLFGIGRVRLVWPSTVIVAFTLLFFAWSGVVARAFPFFLREAAPELPRHPLAMALAPGESVTLEVPRDARSLIVSGANVAHFRRGAILGRIEPGPLEVRIGDAADWGALRREIAYGARNPLPRDPAGRIRGHGYNAWLDGAGRVPLPRGARSIRVTGDASLPPNATLQVEGFE